MRFLSATGFGLATCIFGVAWAAEPKTDGMEELSRPPLDQLIVSKARGEPPIGRERVSSTSKLRRSRCRRAYGIATVSMLLGEWQEFKPRPASCLQALIAVQGRHKHIEAGDGPTCEALLQVQKARISPSFIGQQPPWPSTLHRSCDHSLDSQLEGVGVREAYLQPHALWSLLTRRTVCVNSSNNLLVAWSKNP